MTEKEPSTLAQELAKTIFHFRTLAKSPGLFHGIKRGDFMLLASLQPSDGPDMKGVRVSDLSNRLQVTSAAITQAINSLEENGYVERIADPGDRRVVLIQSTEKGRELLKLAYGRHLKRLQGLVDYLGEPDSRELIRLLSLVQKHLQENIKEDSEC